VTEFLARISDRISGPPNNFSGEISGVPDQALILMLILEFFSSDLGGRITQNQL
jgi:hypothetical protein